MSFDENPQPWASKTFHKFTISIAPQLIFEKFNVLISAPERNEIKILLVFYKKNFCLTKFKNKYPTSLLNI